MTSRKEGSAAGRAECPVWAPDRTGSCRKKCPVCEMWKQRGFWATEGACRIASAGYPVEADSTKVMSDCGSNTGNEMDFYVYRRVSAFQPHRGLNKQVLPGVPV